MKYRRKKTLVKKIYEFSKMFDINEKPKKSNLGKRKRNTKAEGVVKA